MAYRITWTDSLTTTKPSFDKFAKLQEDILSAGDPEIELHIEIESRLGLSLLFCLSTLTALAESHGISIQILCNKLATLRDALLPKLMSGEIDVSAVQL